MGFIFIAVNYSETPNPCSRPLNGSLFINGARPDSNGTGAPIFIVVWVFVSSTSGEYWNVIHNRSILSTVDRLHSERQAISNLYFIFVRFRQFPTSYVLLLVSESCYMVPGFAFLWASELVNSVERLNSSSQSSWSPARALKNLEHKKISKYFQISAIY